jgi:prepilin-type N-terminal cleavage/methylation domain-containing protein/prepilin-type processing-associated H-X9-DG protein
MALIDIVAEGDRRESYLKGDVRMRKKGFTLIELLVVIAIIAMLMAILMPALSKVKKIAMRVICGTNLKGLGTAQTVYANDYDDEYAVQGGTATTLSWAESFTGWQNPNKTWDGSQTVTIGASLYLLVREADVSPKSFVCPAGDEAEYDGQVTHSSNPDIVQLWDFGSIDDSAIMGGNSGPTNCVSYSYHMPYGSNQGKSKYAADGTRSAAFAYMADKNPWMDHKLTVQESTDQTLPDSVQKVWSYWEGGISESDNRVQQGNTQPHDREGQNVAFADGHSAYEKTADVGVKHDNIYTPWSNSDPTDEVSIRKGANAKMNGIKIGVLDADHQPLGSTDSLLLNDDEI